MKSNTDQTTEFSISKINAVYNIEQVREFIRRCMAITIQRVHKNHAVACNNLRTSGIFEPEYSIPRTVGL